MPSKINVADYIGKKYGRLTILSQAPRIDKGNNTRFYAFYDWAINNGWKKGLKTDRKNNDGNYEPSNCHFVTPWRNSVNRRDTFRVHYKGEDIAAALLVKDFKISRETFINRIKKGWNVEKALTEKPRWNTLPRFKI